MIDVLDKEAEYLGLFALLTAMYKYPTTLAKTWIALIVTNAFQRQMTFWSILTGCDWPFAILLLCMIWVDLQTVLSHFNEWQNSYGDNR